VKPILVLIAVVLAIGSAIPADAFGQRVTVTTERRLTTDQMGEEIAAWKEQLAEIVKDLSDPSKIWVALRGGTTVATDDEELVQALREQKIMDLIWLADQARVIGARELRLEDKSLFREEVEAFVKKTYAELVKQDKAIREIKERQAERLREIIRRLEKERADLLAAQPRQAGTPAFKPDEATVSDSDKAAVRNALEPVRLEDQWDLRDHGYVLGYLDKVKTPSQLRLVNKLIADFTACYKAWLAELARIEAAAKAGNWIPGQRIGARSKALDVRNDRLKEIKSSFEEDWQTP
jgi:hypothetical protein